MRNLVRFQRLKYIVLAFSSSLVLQIFPSSAFATPVNGNIVVYDNEKISSISADGSSATSLYTYETNPSDPNATSVDDISINGKRVVFEKNNKQALFVTNVFGDDSQTIATVTGSDVVTGAQFSRDGKQIVYIKETSSEVDLMLYNVDSGTNTQLASVAGGLSAGPFFFSPSFSYDGTKVLYGQENLQRTASSIQIVSVAGGNPTTVVNASKFDVPLTFSPDGTKIVYGREGASTSSVATAAELHAIDTSGSNDITLDTIAAPLCTDPGPSTPCSVDPNYTEAVYNSAGTSIAYTVSYSLVNTQGTDNQQSAPLKTVDSGGGNIATLDNGTWPYTAQAQMFSPDGLRVLYHKSDSNVSGTPIRPFSITTAATGSLAYEPSNVATGSAVRAETWLEQGPSWTQGANGTISSTVPSGTDYSANSYTVIDKETLTVDGQLGTVTVQSGGTLKGSGTLGTVTIESGGHIAPGHSPGCLTMNSLTLSSGSNYDAEIGGTTACSGYDQLLVNGPVNVTGASLNISLYGGFVPKVGQSYTIVNNGTTNPVTGTFNGLPEGASFTSQGVTYKITYVGNTGNDIVLTVTNVDSSKLPSVPNTGMRLITAHPLLGIGSAIISAGTLLYANRRLVKPAYKR